LTVGVAARKTRLDAADWRQWESGVGEPDINQFKSIHRLLKPDAHWFMGVGIDD